MPLVWKGDVAGVVGGGRLLQYARVRGTGEMTLALESKLLHIR